MDTLPNELLADLTRHLSLTHAARLARTCKENHRRIWMGITTLTEKETCRFSESTTLSKFKNLESLQISSAPFPQDLSNLTTLQKIGTIDLYSAEAMVLTNLTNLTALSVGNAKSGQSCIAPLEDLLKNHTRLASLSVLASKLHTLDPLSWQFLTRLRELSLHEFNSSNHDVLGLSKLWSLTQLRSLWLSSITPTAMLTGLSKLRNLEHLSIYDSTSNNNGWLVDYNELVGMSKLRGLWIMLDELDEEMHNIFAKLTQLESLDVLAEDSQEIHIYSNLTNLTELSFRFWTAGWDEGLDFTNMTKLEVLTMSWCQTVTKLGLLKNLRELYLTGADNEPGGLSFLQDLHSLEHLSIAADLIPKSITVNLSGLTNLHEIDIFAADSWSRKFNFKEFLHSMTTLPCLTKLSLGYFNPSLLPIIATLPHLRKLVLPKTASDLENQSYYPFTFEFK